VRHPATQRLQPELRARPDHPQQRHRPLGTGGTVCLYSDQTTNLIADVNGAFVD
jgi:hypothetical protein